MHLIYKTSFIKDVRKSEKSILKDLNDTLSTLEAATDLVEIKNIKKLKGHSTAYRIRIQSYRMCFYFEDKSIHLTRFLPRKDVYKFFP